MAAPESVAHPGMLGAAEGGLLHLWLAERLARRWAMVALLAMATAVIIAATAKDHASHNVSYGYVLTALTALSVAVLAVTHVVWWRRARERKLFDAAHFGRSAAWRRHAAWREGRARLVDAASWAVVILIGTGNAEIVFEKAGQNGIDSVVIGASAIVLAVGIATLLAALGGSVREIIAAGRRRPDLPESWFDPRAYVPGRHLGIRLLAVLAAVSLVFRVSILAGWLGLQAGLPGTADMVLTAATALIITALIVACVRRERHHARTTRSALPRQA